MRNKDTPEFIPGRTSFCGQKGSLCFNQLFVGVFFMLDRSPGIEFGICLPRADGAHPVEFFGYFTSKGVDTGVMEDLTVVDFVFRVVFFFDGEVVIREKTFHNDTDRPHHVAMADDDATFAGEVAIDGVHDAYASADENVS